MLLRLYYYASKEKLFDKKRMKFLIYLVSLKLFNQIIYLYIYIPFIYNKERISNDSEMK